MYRSVKTGKNVKNALTISLMHGGSIRRWVPLNISGKSNLALFSLLKAHLSGFHQCTYNKCLLILNMQMTHIFVLLLILITYISSCFPCFWYVHSINSTCIYTVWAHHNLFLHSFIVWSLLQFIRTLFFSSHTYSTMTHQPLLYFDYIYSSLPTCNLSLVLLKYTWVLAKASHPLPLSWK